tara:strand:+ start:366 stop:803 length:438 start_codon:yes stop_codon:yes gene_type:complete
MLDYMYEAADYFRWIRLIIEYSQQNYQAEVVLTADEDAFIYERKGSRIQVAGSYTPRDKLYVLLHEVGHLSRMMENPKDNTYFMDRAGDKNSIEKTMTVMEEVLAWRKGEEIADRLDIPIERRAWQRLVNKSVQKYLDWTVEKVV